MSQNRTVVYAGIRVDYTRENATGESAMAVLCGCVCVRNPVESVT